MSSHPVARAEGDEARPMMFVVPPRTSLPDVTTSPSATRTQVRGHAGPPGPNTVASRVGAEIAAIIGALQQQLPDLSCCRSGAEFVGKLQHSIEEKRHQGAASQKTPSQRCILEALADALLKIERVAAPLGRHLDQRTSDASRSVIVEDNPLEHESSAWSSASDRPGPAPGNLEEFRFGLQVLEADDDEDGCAASNFSSATPTPKGLEVCRSQRVRHFSMSHDAHGYEVLNDYTILDEIGSGASGTVMLALHSRTQEPFAVKAVAKPRKLKFGRALPAFDIEREVAVMKKLRHPHIVQLHEVIDDPDEHMIYLVMDYVPNGPCAHGALDAATGRWRFDVVQPEERLVRLARQIAEGLRYLHKRGIVHRDVKPDNLLLDACDNVKIADFGISEFRANARCDGEAGLRANPLRGSYAFMSPEACRGDPMGPASDIWSLGITLFAMKFGFLPFDEGTAAKTVAAVLSDPLVIPAECTDEWRGIIEGLLNKDESERMSLKALLALSLLRRVSEESSGLSQTSQQPRPDERRNEDEEEAEDEDVESVVAPHPPNAGSSEEHPERRHIVTRSDARVTFFSEQRARLINQRRSMLGFGGDLAPLLPMIFSSPNASSSPPELPSPLTKGGAAAPFARRGTLTASLGSGAFSRPSLLPLPPGDGDCQDDVA